MSRADFKTDWIPFRDGILTRFPDLSEGDLSDADGDVTFLSKRLSDKADIPLAEAQERLNAFLMGPMPADAFSAPQHDGAAIEASGRYVPEGEDPLSDDARFGDDDQADRPMGRKIA